MIDEFVEKAVKSGVELAKASWSEIKITIQCFYSVYLSGVRKVEMVTVVSFIFGGARWLMEYVGRPDLVVSVSLIASALAALIYLRIPKKPEAQPHAPTVEKCEAEKEITDAP